MNAEYRSSADYARNSGDGPSADDEAEFWAWVDAQEVAAYINQHSTITN